MTTVENDEKSLKSRAILRDFATALFDAAAEAGITVSIENRAKITSKAVNGYFERRGNWAKRKAR